MNTIQCFSRRLVAPAPDDCWAGRRLLCVCLSGTTPRSKVEEGRRRPRSETGSDDRDHTYVYHDVRDTRRT